LTQSTDALAKLKWRCRRGTKELDFLLEAYLEKSYSQASRAEQALFEDLLTFQDSQLILYLLGDKVPESIELDCLLKQIRYYFTSD